MMLSYSLRHSLIQINFKLIIQNNTIIKNSELWKKTGVQTYLITKIPDKIPKLPLIIQNNPFN